jgi:ubiquitin C-terminal hydrolase
MNSALQCLLHTPQLINAALTGKFAHEEKPNAKCAEAFRELILKFANNEKANEAEKPSKLKKEIGKIYFQFAEYSQEDTFEFLTLFVETLNDQLNRVRTKSKYQTLEQDSSNYDLLVISILIYRVKNGLIIVRTEKIV